MAVHVPDYIESTRIKLEESVKSKLICVGLDFESLDFEFDIVKKLPSDNMTEEEKSILSSNKDKLSTVCDQMKCNSLLSTYVQDRKSELAGSMPNDKIIKKITTELYDMLPHNKNFRMCCINVRDLIIELNYSWFGYVASKKVIVNSCVSYEDKFQSAACIFCKMWWWFRWPGGRYRTDLSFSSFFKPRITEEMERDLNEVQYSIRRTLLVEAAKQLGKHWAKVTYDDLAKVNLPADKMNSLKAIFGSMYWGNLDDHERYIDGSTSTSELDVYYDDMYDGVDNLLIHEMVINESRLTDKDLMNMSNLYSIPFEVLKTSLPSALEKLHEILIREQDKREMFQD